MIPIEEIQNFYSLPIGERIDKFLEYEFVPKEQVVAFEQSIILSTIQEKFPDLFFTYFNDYLEEDTLNYNRCHQAHMSNFNGDNNQKKIYDKLKEGTRCFVNL